MKDHESPCGSASGTPELAHLEATAVTKTGNGLTDSPDLECGCCRTSGRWTVNNMGQRLFSLIWSR